MHLHHHLTELLTSLTNLLSVVGEAEANAKAVNIRNRDDVGNKQRQDEIMHLDEYIAKLVSLKSERRLENKLQ